MSYPENIEEIKMFAKDVGIDVKYLLGKKWKRNMLLGFVRHVPANVQFNVDGWLGFVRVDSVHSNVIFNVDGNVSLPFVHKVKVIW